MSYDAGKAQLAALLRPDDDGRQRRLAAPRVGLWQPSVSIGDAVSPGRLLGMLQILGRRVAVIAPEGARGVVLSDPGAGGALRRAVEYGETLLDLGEASDAALAADAGSSAGAGAGGDANQAGAGAGGRPVRSPIDGIVYLRPSPDAPLFVEVGQRLSRGQTLALVEVMKTFNPVRYGDAGEPDGAEVVSVGVRDQQEVAAGDALIWVR